LNRPSCFLLYDHCTVANSGACDEIANLDPDKIAASQFAIDREIKQSSIPHFPVSIQHEANSPDFLRLKRPSFRPAFHAGPLSTGSKLECPIAFLRWPELATEKNAQFGGCWP
jgi:hypothetical protein